jgi:hypothetical protein
VREVAVEDMVTLVATMWQQATRDVRALRNGDLEDASFREMRAKVPRDKAVHLANTNKGWFIEDTGEKGAASEAGAITERI